MRTRKSGAIASFIAATVAIASVALAAASTTPKKGFIFAAAKSGKTTLHKEPDAKSSEAAFAPPFGARLRYTQVTGDATAPEWYFVDVSGLTPGWLARADAADAQPKPLPPGRKLYLTDITVNAQPVAAMTSAGNGLDRRIAGYALSKAATKGAGTAGTDAIKRAGLTPGAIDDGTLAWALALRDYNSVTHHLQIRYRDMAGDGKTKNAAGEVAAPGSFPDEKIADGRFDAAKKFREGLK